jgi:adenylate cyclase
MNHLNAATFDKAREFLESAMVEDPNFAMPVAWLARWHSLRIGQGWSPARQQDAERAIELANRAIGLDRNNAIALATYGHLRSYLFHDYDTALMYFDRALGRCPNSAPAHVLCALTLAYVGRGEQAIQHGEHALRLSPVDQLLFFYYNAMAWAHFSLEQYEQAIRWARMSASENPKFTANLRILTAALSAAQHNDNARAAAQCLIRLEPTFSLRRYEQTLQPFRDEALRGRLMENLAKAGLPE